MHQNKFSWVIVAAFVAVVAGCGGSNSHPKIQFTSQVTFGDSLSDVGTYAVGTIATLGGGRYTVNSALSNGMPAPVNWTELMAVTLNQSAPCPAVTGLNGSAVLNLNVPVAFHTPGCTNYAQGGAMVTYPYGPGNANVAPFPNGNPINGSALLGQLTVPIVSQIQNHLAAHGGSFSGTEVVFLLAGGNDAIVNTSIYFKRVQDAITSGGAAAGQAEAVIARQAAIQAMSDAGTQLAGYINNMILRNGARYVVVLNLPDLSTTPFGFQTNAQLPGTQAVIDTMVKTYNSRLAADLNSSAVLLVDVHRASVDQFQHPSEFGLTNVTDTACNLAPSVNLLGSSLICTANNVIPGDISHYAFADTVHPTPYGNVLIARSVTDTMERNGWL